MNQLRRSPIFEKNGAAVRCSAGDHRNLNEYARPDQANTPMVAIAISYFVNHAFSVPVITANGRPDAMPSSSITTMRLSLNSVLRQSLFGFFGFAVVAASVIPRPAVCAAPSSAQSRAGVADQSAWPPAAKCQPASPPFQDRDQCPPSAR